MHYKLLLNPNIVEKLCERLGVSEVDLLMLLTEMLSCKENNQIETDRKLQILSRFLLEAKLSFADYKSDTEIINENRKLIAHQKSRYKTYIESILYDIAYERYAKRHDRMVKPYERLFDVLQREYMNSTFFEGIPLKNFTHDDKVRLKRLKRHNIVKIFWRGIFFVRLETGTSRGKMRDIKKFLTY